MGPKTPNSNDVFCGLKYLGKLAYLHIIYRKMHYSDFGVLFTLENGHTAGRNLMKFNIGKKQNYSCTGCPEIDVRGCKIIFGIQNFIGASATKKFGKLKNFQVEDF